MHTKVEPAGEQLSWKGPGGVGRQQSEHEPIATVPRRRLPHGALSGLTAQQTLLWAGWTRDIQMSLLGCINLYPIYFQIPCCFLSFSIPSSSLPLYVFLFLYSVHFLLLISFCHSIFTSKPLSFFIQLLKRLLFQGFLVLFSPVLSPFILCRIVFLVSSNISL